MDTLWLASNWQALLTAAVVLGTVFNLLVGQRAPDMVMIGAAVLLLAAGVLTPAETFQGMANEGMLTVAALFVVAAAIERTGAAEIKFWERTISRREQTDLDFRRAQDFVSRTGALAATLDLATDYAEAAKRALSGLTGPWRTALEDLADFAVSRSA